MTHLKQHNEDVGDGDTDAHHEHDVVDDKDLDGVGHGVGDSHG